MPSLGPGERPALLVAPQLKPSLEARLEPGTGSRRGQLPHGTRRAPSSASSPPPVLLPPLVVGSRHGPSRHSRLGLVDCFPLGPNGDSPRRNPMDFSPRILPDCLFLFCRGPTGRPR